MDETNAKFILKDDLVWACEHEGVFECIDDASSTHLDFSIDHT